MRRHLLFLFLLLGLSTAFAQDISNPQTNASALTTGTLATARGGVNLSAWTAYTPTAVAQTPGITPPTFTVNNGSYWLNGKTVTARADVSITAAGTGLGGILISLPFTAAAFSYVGGSIEVGVTGASGYALILSGGTIMNCKLSTASTYIVTGQRVVAEVTYEIP